MFSELVESVAEKNATNEPWGFLLSFAMQSACLLLLILIPLIYTQALPKALFGTFLVAPGDSAPVAPRAPAGTAISTQRPSRLFHDGIVNEPTAIPSHIEIFAEPPLPPENSSSFGAGGVDGSTDLFHFLDDSARPQSPAPPAQAAPPPANALPQRVAQGGLLEAAKLIVRVQPIYPVLAQQTRTQGDVVLHAIIDKDGRVSELQVISGHPLLVKSAMDAVSQWRYQPTLLNGQPVEVDTTITVTFVLGG